MPSREEVKAALNEDLQFVRSQSSAKNQLEIRVRCEEYGIAGDHFTVDYGDSVLAAIQRILKDYGGSFACLIHWGGEPITEGADAVC